jgi:hypothetical protein
MGFSRERFGSGTESGPKLRDEAGAIRDDGIGPLPCEMRDLADVVHGVDEHAKAPAEASTAGLCHPACGIEP